MKHPFTFYIQKIVHIFIYSAQSVLSVRVQVDLYCVVLLLVVVAIRESMHVRERIYYVLSSEVTRELIWIVTYV